MGGSRSDYFIPDCHEIALSANYYAHHKTESAARKCIDRSDKALVLMGCYDNRPNEYSKWHNLPGVKPCPPSE